MKAKEKAKELVDKFKPNVCECNCGCTTSSCDCSYEETGIIFAKMCAEICVDEIIKEYDEEVIDSNDVFRLEYWKEVKEEINKYK